MSTWAELRKVILDLKSRRPCPLSAYPDPRMSEDQHPPFPITLSAWALAEAAEIREQFGDDVILTVGSLSYPRPDSEPNAEPRPSWWCEMREPAEEAHLTVTLDEPLVVRSGHSLRTSVIVSNLSARDVTILTNGRLQSRIVGPDGAAVGAYVGAQRMPGLRFPLPSGATLLIPVLIGTDSLDPTLGYAVPPGSWFAQIDVNVGDGRRLRSALLPIEIVE